MDATARAPACAPSRLVVCDACSKPFSSHEPIYTTTTCSTGHIYHEHCTTARTVDIVRCPSCHDAGCAHDWTRAHALERVLDLLGQRGTRHGLHSDSVMYQVPLRGTMSAAASKADRQKTEGGMTGKDEHPKRPPPPLEEPAASQRPTKLARFQQEDDEASEDDEAREAMFDPLSASPSNEPEADLPSIPLNITNELIEAKDDEAGAALGDEHEDPIDDLEKRKRKAWFSRKVDEFGAPPHSQYVRSVFA